MSFFLNRHQLDQVAKSLVDPQESLEPELQSIRALMAPLVAFQIRAAGLRHWKELTRGKSLEEIVQESSWKALDPRLKDAISRRVRKYLDCLR